MNVISSRHRWPDRLTRWLLPKRIVVYPAALSLGAMAFLAGLLVLAKASGIPLFSLLGRDFTAFYTGGRFALDGRLDQLYDLVAQQSFQSTLVSMGPGQLAPFMYPPFTVVPFALFAWGDYAHGLVLWWLAGLCALWLSIRLARQEIPICRGWSTPRLFAACVLFHPTLAWMLFGQNTVWTLLIYTAAFVALRRGRDLDAGLLLGLLLYKPQLVLAMGVVLLVKRRWRGLLGVFLTATGWILLGVLVAPQAMLEYLGRGPTFVELMHREGSAVWGVTTLYGFSTLLLGGLWPTGGRVLGGALITGALAALEAWWWRTPWHPGSTEWDFGMAATFAAGLIITPYLFHYDLMLLLLPIAIAWDAFRRRASGPAVDEGPLPALTALLYLATLVGSYLTHAQLRVTTALGLPPFAVQLATPVVALWAWCVARTGLTPRRPGEMALLRDSALLFPEGGRTPRRNGNNIPDTLR